MVEKGGGTGEEIHSVWVLTLENTASFLDLKRKLTNDCEDIIVCLMCLF